MCDKSSGRRRMKKLSIIANCILLFWFLLDMIGAGFHNHILVKQSWKEDGIFMSIYIVLFLLFLLKDQIGLYILPLWLLMWLATQFFFHWYLTIFGPWEGKIKYFADTIKLFPSSIRYIPDLYHIVLHLLILFALISTSIYCFGKRKRERRLISR